MKEIKEIPTTITVYVSFVRNDSPTGSCWSFGTMADTKEHAAHYCSYYKVFKIFEVELPI